VGNATLWSDGRAAGQVGRWAAEGVLERAFRINGSLSFSGLPNAILAWLHEHDRERLSRAHKALYCGGWLLYRLTGAYACDESDASAPFLDIRSRRYSDELLRLYGLEWARPLLPPIRGDAERVLPLSRAAATELGLPAGLPVVMAPLDVAATAIGVGAVAPGQACVIVGTTLCTEVVVDQARTEGEPAGYTLALGAPDRYLRAYATMSGTEVVDWAARMLGLPDAADVARLAAAAEPAGGAVVLPYLSPAGERAPFFDPLARGTCFGLSLEQGPEHFAGAVLEGLTMTIRDCLAASATRPRELRLCGGGARSGLWCQLIADVTGITTLRSADTEVGARGAFVTALVAAGEEPDLVAAASRLELRDRFEPRSALTGRYDKRYATFVELRQPAREAWAAMAPSREGGPPAGQADAPT